MDLYDLQSRVVLMTNESYDDRWVYNRDAHKAVFLQIPEDSKKFKTERSTRICQNENCDKELKPNQKRFCSRKCYQDSRALKKVGDALTRLSASSTFFSARLSW